MQALELVIFGIVLGSLSTWGWVKRTSGRRDKETAAAVQGLEAVLANHLVLSRKLN